MRYFKLLSGTEDVLVSIDGQVGRIRHDFFRPLSPRINNMGYGRIRIIINGKSEERLVHRLVAESFIVNSNNYPIVNHKDGDKCNNKYTNLEWCTQKQNMQHAFKNGLVIGGGRPKKQCLVCIDILSKQ